MACRPCHRWFSALGLGLDGVEAAHEHDPADPGGGAENAFVSKLDPDFSLAITAVMALEDGFGFQSVLFVGRQHESGGVVIAAVGNAKGVADPSDALAGGLVDAFDYFVKLGRDLVPITTSVFLKCHFFP